MQARKSLGASATFKTRLIESVQAAANRVVEVVKRPDFAKGFVLLPKRWRDEQSIGALTGSRRLKLDYETLTQARVGFLTRPDLAASLNGRQMVSYANLIVLHDQ